MPPLGTPDESTMIQRMYTEMIGIDGQGGLVNTQRVIKKDVEWIKENMVTEEECANRREMCEEHEEKQKDKAVSKRRSIWLVVKDIVIVTIAAFSVLISLGVFKTN